MTILDVIEQQLKEIKGKHAYYESLDKTWYVAGKWETLEKKLRSFASAILESIDREITEQMNTYANTPLKDRKNAFNELASLSTRLSESIKTVKKGGV